MTKAERQERISAGAVFGRLTVVALGDRRYDRTHWTCQCDCGRISLTSQNNLLAERSRSCGCLRRELSGRPRFSTLAEFVRGYCEQDGIAGCWVWKPTLAAGGYGRLSYRGRTRQAHVVAWELAHGTVPVGLELDHLCRNRACCNPAHLEPVTRRENVLRGEGIAARNAVKAECANGHAFTPDNTKWKGRTRQCRACANQANRTYRQRMKETGS